MWVKIRLSRRGTPEGLAPRSLQQLTRSTTRGIRMAWHLGGPKANPSWYHNKGLRRSRRLGGLYWLAELRRPLWPVEVELEQIRCAWLQEVKKTLIKLTNCQQRINFLSSRLQNDAIPKFLSFRVPDNGRSDTSRCTTFSGASSEQKYTLLQSHWKE